MVLNGSVAHSLFSETVNVALWLPNNGPVKIVRVLTAHFTLFTVAFASTEPDASNAVITTLKGVTVFNNIVQYLLVDCVMGIDRVMGDVTRRLGVRVVSGWPLSLP